MRRSSALEPMVKMLAAALLVLGSSSAYALQAANDVDLRAAYCFGRLKDMKPLDLGNYDGERAALAKTVNDRVASAQRRLRAYLLPRLEYVDGHAIMAAAQAGEEDQRAYLPAIEECWKASNREANTAAAIAASKKCSAQTTSDKLQECEAANFLPF